MSEEINNSNPEASVVTLPKGTLLHINGFPCELIAETPVICATIAACGSYSAYLDSDLSKQVTMQNIKSVNDGYCQDCGKKITPDNDSGLEGVLQCGEHCKALCKDCVKKWDYINLFPKDQSVKAV